MLKRMTVGDSMRGNIYAFVYGETGSGKTTLVLTLSDKQGEDVGIITPETTGGTSIATMGFPKTHLIAVRPGAGTDPIADTITAVKQLTADPGIKAFSVDGITSLAGMYIDFRTEGEGEKQMGWDGWGDMLTAFRKLEHACEKAVDAGKSVILTAWANPPKYVETMGGKTLDEPGRPLLQGKASVWLPGRADIIARQSSKFVSVVENGKSVKKFKSELQVRGTDMWLAKTRFNSLPDPCPADLRAILKLVQEASGVVPSKAPTKAPVKKA